ncbi:hypothetical protein HZU77_011535 [Neisseriaceae bacterium TC5R-5]|nr:hypothetical protein [Neisseriaceae bacterium TC5R-5]
MKKTLFAIVALCAANFALAAQPSSWTLFLGWEPISQQRVAVAPSADSVADSKEVCIWAPIYYDFKTLARTLGEQRVSTEGVDGCYYPEFAPN